MRRLGPLAALLVLWQDEHLTALEHQELTLRAIRRDHDSDGPFRFELFIDAGELDGIGS